MNCIRNQRYLSVSIAELRSKTPEVHSLDGRFEVSRATKGVFVGKMVSWLNVLRLTVIVSSPIATSLQWVILQIGKL